MRVAHLLRKYNPSEWGGTETAVLQLAADMAKIGVDSVVFAPRIPGGGSHADPFAAAGIEVRRFRACVPVWGISPERRRQMVSVGGNLLSFGLAGSLMREEGVDVIHSHALGRLGAIGRLAAWAKGLPFVISINGGAYDLPKAVRDELRGPAGSGWDWGRPFGLMLRARQLLGQADAIITLNPREAALIRERHPGRRVLVEQHGIPTALFASECRPAASAAFPAIVGRQVLLVLGRIDQTKNQGWVVAQAGELARRHPGALLVFVGAVTDREYAAAMEARILSEGLGERVLLAGSLPFGDSRLIGLLQQARAVVLPSVSETFGIVILEAWSAGTPVLSSRTSGAVALIDEGANGLIFDLEEPGGFHAAIDTVLGRPDLAGRMGAAGRAKAVSHFDSSARAGRMKVMYEELIGEKHALRHSSRR